MNFFLTTKMFSLKSFTLPKEQFLWQVAWNKWFQCWRVSCIMKSDWWVITEDAFLPLASRAKTRRGQIRYASNITSYWQNSSSNRNIPLKKFPRWLKCVCVCDKWLQSPPTLCDPVDCGLPGSSVHEILQARMLEWVALPSYRRYSKPRDGTHISYISCIGRWFLYHYCHLVSPRN